MRRLMRLVVERGTGKRADAPGYLVGGKTGTAEKQVAGHYARHKLISSFVGAFPINAPRYLILAVLDEPKGTKETFNYATGGWVAAPVVKHVVERMGPLVGMTPVDPEAPDLRRDLAVNVTSEAHTTSEGHTLASF
jgi:cell division protein FtsI (penicillin-binding protein 3)